MAKQTVPHKYSQRTFRPWPENQLNFDFAEKQRFNVSELINEIVAKNFKRHVATKIKLDALAMEKRFGKSTSRTNTKSLVSKSR